VRPCPLTSRIYNAYRFDRDISVILLPFIQKKANIFIANIRIPILKFILLSRDVAKGYGLGGVEGQIAV
jgi:hypothetical protein